MADETRLRELLDLLNANLADVTPYKLDLVDPTTVLPLDKNARYMTKRQFDRLTDNIKQDSNLSSLPFCWRRPDGKYICLSGNHRLQGAMKAGVKRILILFTDAQLSKSQQIGIQLAHNSITGQDNPAILRDLWSEIDELKFKVYSGLDDNMLETMKAVDIHRLNEQQLRFEELVLLFLPAEIERLQDILKRLGTKAKKRQWVSRYDDFDRFFNVLLDYKEAANVVNTATALVLLCDLAEEWLAAQQAQQAQETETAA